MAVDAALGAGDGRLSHCLRAEPVLSKASIIATDTLPRATSFDLEGIDATDERGALAVVVEGDGRVERAAARMSRRAW